MSYLLLCFTNKSILIMTKSYIFINRNLIIIILLSFAFISGCSQSNTQTLSSDEIISKLDFKIQKEMKAKKIPGLSIAVIKDFQLLWYKTYGVRDINTNDSVNENTLFDAASMSKPVTAYVALKIHERGELHLDTPLAKYLTYEKLENDPKYKLITCRMVLTHTTGLPNWGNELINKPGEKFGYSGEGFYYLGKVLEKISKMSLQELMLQEVFDPIGMHNSSFDWTDQYYKNGASGHTHNGKVITKNKFKSAHAAGTMVTTAEDYAKFVIAILTGYGLKNETMEQMLKKHVVADNWDESHKIPNIYWGLGWGIQPGKDGNCFFHMGNNRYWRGYIVANRSTGDGVVYFSNSENGHEIAKTIVEIVIDDKHSGLQLVQ